MCLLLIAHEMHPAHPLVLLANRDEFRARPTAPLGFWPNEPQLLAGKDLLAGGTWLGVTRSGRIAAVTNYREPGAHRSGAPSRGNLVHSYLSADLSPRDWLLQRLQPDLRGPRRSARRAFLLSLEPGWGHPSPAGGLARSEQPPARHALAEGSEGEEPVAGSPPGLPSSRPRGSAGHPG